MRFRQLEYFVAIAEAGSYSAAATKLFVAQPSLSQQIRSLEQELGGELFERVPQGVRLTQAGAIFLDDARKLLKAADDAVRSVRTVLNGDDAELVVSSIRSVASGVLPAFVSRWHTEVPGTVLRLRDFNHRKLVEASVTTGESDIGVGPRPDGWSGPITSLGYEQIVLIANLDAVPHGEPVTGQVSASLEWVMYESEHGFSEVVDTYLSLHGIEPKVAAHSAQVEAALLYAAANVGVTLVPENIVPAAWAQLVHPCTPPFYREVTAFTRPAASALSERCVHTMTDSPLPLDRPADLPADAVLM